MRYAFIILLFFLFMFSEGSLSAQCAMCKQAVETSANNPNSLAKNLNSGILYLMAVPYLMIAFIFRKQIAVLFRKVFKKNKAVN